MRIRRSLAVLVLSLTCFVSVAFQGCTLKASRVIGQPDFISGELNQGKDPAADTLSNPAGPVAFYHDSLYMADTGNNRILVFSPIPTKNNPSATHIIQSSDPARWKNFLTPYGISIVDDSLFVADSDNHRVLIWNKVPTDGETPDMVLGQADLTGEPVQDCSHLNSPRGLFAMKDKLIVSEMDNHRVLIWNSLPPRTEANKPLSPDLVLGNADCTPDQSGSTRHTFNEPRGVWTDGTRLVVVDTGNERVLIWNRFPTSSSDEADIVLGTGKAGSGQNQFSFPYAVTSDGTRLFIADERNHRVLVWNKFPTMSGELPSSVLGKSDFTRSGPNGSAVIDEPVPTAGTLAHPEGIFLRNNELWVTDTGNSRVLMFKVP